MESVLKDYAENEESHENHENTGEDMTNIEAAQTGGNEDSNGQSNVSVTAGNIVCQEVHC